MIAFNRNHHHQGALVLILLTISITHQGSFIECGSRAYDIDGLDKVEEAQEILAKPISRMGQTLMSELVSSNSKAKNIVLSPLSIHSALSMLSLGMKPGSPSERKLFDFLGYNSKSSTSANNKTDSQKAHKAYEKIFSEFKEITNRSELVSKEVKMIEHDPWIVNKLNRREPVLDFWLMLASGKSAELQANFSESIKLHYNSSLRQAADNDEAKALASEVNSWAKEAGFGGDLLSPRELVEAAGSAALTLMSAVRVQGWWINSFSEHNSDDGFYNFADKSKPVKGGRVITNHDICGKFAIFTRQSQFGCLKSDSSSGANNDLDELEFRVAQFPLRGNMTFTIIEPLLQSQGGADHEPADAAASELELTRLERALLTHEQREEPSLLERALRILESRETTYKFVQMPAFKFEAEINLRRALSSRKIGQLSQLFDGQESGLEGITTSPAPMRLKEARHQAVIELDRNGLKGGALVTIKIAPHSAKIFQCPNEFVVKNPFMFLVRYGRLSLFMGHVVSL